MTIEVTREMAQAGGYVIEELHDAVDSEYLARLVYEATVEAAARETVPERIEPPKG